MNQCGQFGSTALSLPVDLDRSPTIAPPLSTRDCRLRRRKRLRMLPIQKVRIALRQRAARMNHPIKVARPSTASLPPAASEVMLPTRWSVSGEHAVTNIAPGDLAPRRAPFWPSYRGGRLFACRVTPGSSPQRACAARYGRWCEFACYRAEKAVVSWPPFRSMPSDGGAGQRPARMDTLRKWQLRRATDPWPTLLYCR